MSISMKNKMNGAALAVCAALSLGYSTVASAADPQNFTTNITISSPFDCPISTTAVTNQWDLTWTLDNETATTGVFDYGTAPKAPLAIVASLDQGASQNCDLSGLKVDADVTGEGVTPVDGQPGFYRKATTNGGYWRYAPVLSRIQLYTDAAGTTPYTGAVTVTDAAGTQHTQEGTAQYIAQTDLTGLTGMNSNDSVSLSDNYLATNALVPLSGATMTAFKMADITVIKQASIGVSAIIAKNPENDEGATDVVAVNNDDVVTLPFTVNVAYR